MNVDAGWEGLFTYDDLMSLHQAEMARRASSTQVAKEGCIEGSLGTSWLAEQYVSADIPGTVPGFIFCCWALQSLALNHCLVDGNKRLAWLAFTSGLAALGLTVDASADDAEAFVNRIITDRLDGPAVVAWVHARVAILAL